MFAGSLYAAIRAATSVGFGPDALLAITASMSFGVTPDRWPRADGILLTSALVSPMLAANRSGEYTDRLDNLASAPGGNEKVLQSFAVTLSIGERDARPSVATEANPSAGVTGCETSMPRGVKD